MRTKDEILDLIDEEGVKFIRLQFTDPFCKLRNVAVTPGQMEKVLNNRYFLEDVAAFGGAFDSTDDDIYLFPDLDTFVILPWRPQQGKVGKLLCDLRYEDGTPFEMSPRTILKKVLSEGRNRGFDFYIDPECEFFLFHTDDSSMPTTKTHELAGYMDVGPSDLGENARRDIVLNLEEMGFDIESSHHERASGQHEVDFKGGEALHIADDIITFKFSVRSIAKRFGLYATFMPKPLSDSAGSGMHLNLSVYKNDRDFLRNPEGKNKLSEEGRYFLGGIMAHAKAMCSITNPIVNSYKRLSTGFDAPIDIVWSTRHKNPLVKVHRHAGEDTKLEIRFPDSAANPYLALAVIIAAGLDGIDKKIEPGEDARILYRNDMPVDKLPNNLFDALKETQKDPLITEVLGEDYKELLYNYQMRDWNGYMREVTDWEVRQYLFRM